MTADMVPRVSCSACFCEIGFTAEPEKNIAHTYADHDDKGRRTHRPNDGEPPLDFDPACPCRCHDVWRIVFGGPT